MRPIYFSGSISGGRADRPLYVQLVALLEEAGFRVFAGQVTNGTIGAGGEAGDPRAIFERDLGWLDEIAANRGALVAEVTTPSLGVGYEIAAARYRFAIPVVALFRPAAARRCSAMIAGDPGVTLIEYDEGDLQGTVRLVGEAIERATSQGTNDTTAPHVHREDIR